MEPVVGLDVSKGMSVAQAFTSRNEVAGKSKNIVHTEEGFEEFGEWIRELRLKTGKEPVVVLEATGHYHRGLVAYMERSGVCHMVINPLQSKRAKGSQLRKVKTDTADAWHLAEMYYRGDVKPHRNGDKQLLELQHLTRQHEFITAMYVQAKLNMRALLDQVFPAFEGVSYDLYSPTAMRVLQQYLSGVVITEETILETVQRSHGQTWVREKLAQLQSVTPSQGRSSAQTIALQSMLGLLLAFQEQLGHLEQQIEETVAVIPEVALLKTIPGVGDKLAATLVAEIGDATQFGHAKQLVAYAGLDPSVFSSGKFTATSSKITKRGSKRLRRALYLAVQCGLRKGKNERIKAYYDKKKKEGKPYKVAVIACANKLLHHVYAILTRGEPYHT
ncbi:IS110 family RNA-guided transposase [Paenibacillus hexagrammi]|uniref:IS110 family transposase n=1 Tax=Paenibacillus hexagrammi TaxID=2908839 RepID=A0ABY3SJK4_9BACL|nr:IS110 family transposase [Paenibacillus sp. YPD9-1]UJF34229.1 IS110 family transposase [Paenibacillus sp. YPD9-1]